jgi:hypothetical protein
MTWNELKALLASGRHHYDPDRLEASPLGLKRFAAIARDYRHHNGGMFAGSFRTHDTVTGTAINFRMPAGFPGCVNRSHPASIEPVLIDASAPPLLYGQAVLIDPTTQGVRPIVAGDLTASAFDCYGVTVRPFPLQQATVTGALYTAVPPTSGVIDVAREAYIMIGFNKSGSAPVKNGQAYVWAAATSGAHIQSGWETAAGTLGTNTVSISVPPRTNYQGGWDANNVGELSFHF